MLHSPPEKIVLGLGGTVDYEIEFDSTVVNKLITEHQISAKEISNTIPINSERDLVLNLLAFLQSGTGGERFVSQSSLIENFANRCKFAITLGGTCVRAAMAMDVLGIASTLHLVSISNDVRRLLPKSAKYICSSNIDTFDPHLIVQFRSGEEICSSDINFVTPHPNRIIFTNDLPNQELVISDQLGYALCKARIFLISGFNCIQDRQILDERITSIKDHLKQLPKDAIVFFEDAGYHVPELSKVVRMLLVNQFDVYSMNEEEMQFYLGQSLDLLDAGVMSVAFKELYAVIGAKVLVVHTGYWSVAIGRNANNYKSALHGGVTMASTRFCFGDNLTLENYEAVSNYEINPQGETFALNINSALADQVVCIPAFVLDVEKPTTIGLGDSFVGGFIAALFQRL